MVRKYAWADYKFHVLNPEASDFPDGGGVYVFARSIPDRPGALFDPHVEWDALYIGRAKSFRNRVTENHKKWEEARDLGFRHVHILRVDDSELRKSIEAHLIQEYEPPLNDMGK